MKSIHLLIVLIFPFSIFAQDPGDCDLVNIECCEFDLTEQTLTIQASNQSTNIFSYPGFILFDNNMDTVAMETVNYYGIGTFPQAHKLDIIKAVVLPFDGYLELHTLFYGVYECTFPLSIADTTTVGIGEDERSRNISVYPNPASEFINIAFDNNNPKQALTTKIINLAGRELYSGKLQQSDKTITTANFKQGKYFVLVMDNNNQIVFKEKIIIN